jgi:class 3 adenylate cyclase/tetratricopeptide (TPR) repeat protein
VASCPVCEHDNPSGAKFCSECGAALVAASERREERKVVTVLFADLVGFTSQAEKLDPEDVRAVLAPYWERLRVELERFGGTVEKFIGDAVMALFGAPVAHEDDPERAVRAALAIRDWAREEEGLQVRIAVNTGEALVLLGSRPAEGEGMAAGDVVNTAARLQSAAPVNGILVGETTYRATRDAIDYAEREPVSAKGKAEPVPVWEALDARSRMGVDIEQGPALPLVGRVREIETILGAFDRARTERETQLVTLVGVPGIGKSRLVAELFALLDAQPDLVWWRQGRALPYGEGVSYWALAEMVKAQAGIQENDDAEAADAKLRASVDASVDSGDRAWVTQHLLPLIGVDQDDAGDRKDERFAAWRRYLEGLAEQRPLILVFEDLHWADDGLLDFVDHLADWAGSVPLLVLCTARPELLDRRVGWGGGKLNATTLALTPLADSEAAQIIQAVLDQALLPAETQQALLERAGGNPLYAEQFARLFVERGTAEDMPLPETVQGIIAARLDMLEPLEKRLLQDAAVVGKVFWAGAAAELADVERGEVTSVLHALERRGLVRRERRSSVGGEDEYAFRHVLVRDVAYGQIPRAARAERHVRAARWIDDFARADDQAELVAHHYGAAMELGADAATAARVAFRRAGDRALRLNAFANAERFYAEALALEPDDRERPYLLAGQARARVQAEGDAGADLDAARDALIAVGDIEAAAEIGVLAANVAWRAGSGGDAQARVAAARSMLEGRPPSKALTAVLAEQARLAVFGNRTDEAREASTKALRLAEELGLDELRANVLNTMAVAKTFDGDLDGADELHDLVLAVDAPTAVVEVARAMTNRVVSTLMKGDHAEVRTRHLAAMDFAKRVGDQRMILWLEAGDAWHAEADGRWDEALARAQAFIARVAPMGGHYLEKSAQLLCAWIHAARGAPAPDVIDEIDHVLAGIEKAEDWQAIIPRFVGSASVLELLGERARATELLDRVLAYEFFPRTPGVPGTLLVALVRLDRADEWTRLLERAVDTPRVRAARLILTGRSAEAADVMLQISGPSDEAAVRLLAAEQLAAEGRRAEADVQLQRALAFYRAVGASRIVRRAETLLAAAG